MLSKFGEYVFELGKKKGIELTQTYLALRLGVSLPYMSDILHGRRYVPQNVLRKFPEIFELTDEEERKLYDLAAAEKGEVALDIKEILYTGESAPEMRSFVREISRYSLDSDQYNRLLAYAKQMKARLGNKNETE